MASYTQGAGDYPRPYRNVRIEHFPEGSSQTFGVGDILILDTTADKGDRVVISGADPGSGTVVGIALEAASGTAETLIPVAVLDEKGEFLIVAANALDRDDIGDEFGIVSDATVKWKLDQSETTAKVFHVLKMGPPDPKTGSAGYAHGDTGGKYIVKAAKGIQAVYAA